MPHLRKHDSAVDGVSLEVDGEKLGCRHKKLALMSRWQSMVSPCRESKLAQEDHVRPIGRW